MTYFGEKSILWILFGFRGIFVLGGVKIGFDKAVFVTPPRQDFGFIKTTRSHVTSTKKLASGFRNYAMDVVCKLSKICRRLF